VNHEIQNILATVGDMSGVVGSAVLTNDGIVVASDLGPSLAADVIAGLSSFLISTTRRSLRDAGMGDFSRLVMSATHGKVVLMDLGEAFLVVLIDQLADINASGDELQRAASELQRAARIEV